MCVSNAVVKCLKTCSKMKPSIEEPLMLELKPLPCHLRYSFLGDGNTLPITISSSLD